VKASSILPPLTNKRKPYPETRGSHLAGQLERKRARRERKRQRRAAAKLREKERNKVTDNGKGSDGSQPPNEGLETVKKPRRRALRGRELPNDLRVWLVAQVNAVTKETAIHDVMVTHDIDNLSAVRSAVNTLLREDAHKWLLGWYTIWIDLARHYATRITERLGTLQGKPCSSVSTVERLEIAELSKAFELANGITELRGNTYSIDDDRTEPDVRNPNDDVGKRQSEWLDDFVNGGKRSSEPEPEPEPPQAEPQPEPEDTGTPAPTEIVRYTEHGLDLACRLDGDQMWPTIAQVAELFGIDRSVVEKHINNILNEGELQMATCASFAQVRTEGKRRVSRVVRHVNQEMVLHVGYRVRSPRGADFRRWATEMIKRGVERPAQTYPQIEIVNALRLTATAIEQQNVRFDGVEQRLDKLERRRAAPERGFGTDMPEPTEDVPEKTLRSHTGDIIKREARRLGWKQGEGSELFRRLWGYLYSEFRTRYHIDIEVEAERAGLEPLDWVESNALIEKLSVRITGDSWLTAIGGLRDD